MIFSSIEQKQATRTRASNGGDRITKPSPLGGSRVIPDNLTKTVLAHGGILCYIPFVINQNKISQSIQQSAGVNIEELTVAFVAGTI